MFCDTFAVVVPPWEEQGPNVLVCIPSVGSVSYEWACTFAELWAARPPGTARAKLGSYVVDIARDQGALTALNGGFKWIFFLDSDVLVPPGTLQRLLSHNRPIVSGFYSRRHQPLHPLLLRYTKDGQVGLVQGYQPGELVDVDLIPSGCLLVSTDVFRKVPRPWFFYTDGRIIEIGGQSITLPNGVSEDYYFSNRARSFGFHPVVDTGLKCGHKGEFNVMPKDDGGFEISFPALNP